MAFANNIILTAKMFNVWRDVVGCVFLDVSKDWSAFGTLRYTQPKKKLL